MLWARLLLALPSRASLQTMPAVETSNDDLHAFLPPFRQKP